MIRRASTLLVAFILGAELIRRRQTWLVAATILGASLIYGRLVHGRSGY